jgi:hypothetical protein
MNVTPSASRPATAGASGNFTHAPIQHVLSVVNPGKVFQRLANPFDYYLAVQQEMH